MATTTTKRGRSSASSKKRTSSSKRSPRSNSDASARDDSERYRRAAEDALQQLDWAIGYLHGINKTKISKALAENRSYIRRNLLGRSEQPLPDQKTSET